MTTHSSVVNKGKYFGVVNNEGKILIPFGLDTIYSITNEGKNKYFMVYYEKTYDVIQYLDSIYKKKTESSSMENTSSSETNSSSITSSNASSNTSTSSATNSSTNSSSQSNSATNASNKQ